MILYHLFPAVLSQNESTLKLIRQCSSGLRKKSHGDLQHFIEAMMAQVKFTAGLLWEALNDMVCPQGDGGVDATKWSEKTLVKLRTECYQANRK